MFPCSGSRASRERGARKTKIDLYQLGIQPTILVMSYHRYEIEVKKTPPIVKHPHRFKVRVKRWRLAAYLIKECFKFRGNRKIIFSRPCVYGVFSGPIGGFAPRDHLCVGCLRCMVEHPEMVTISHNPERVKSEMDPNVIDTLLYEAETGRIPIKGAGYKGKFGGHGLEGIWFDFSEIIRPTRDGIHGREYISTEIILGKDYYPIPILFDQPRVISALSCSIYSQAALELHSLAILPSLAIKKYALQGAHIIPSLAVMTPLDFEPKMIEITTFDKHLINAIKREFPQSEIILRTPITLNGVKEAYDAGIKLFHLKESYIPAFNDLPYRDELFFIGGQDIVLAEHLAKNILLGIDAAALDRPLSIALQNIPREANLDWGVQRLKNLSNAWRDQLLEVLGAMGIKEIRRARGEIGRILFQKSLENDAFKGIPGYEPNL